MATKKKKKKPVKSKLIKAITGTREQMLANARKQAEAIQKGIKSSASKFSSSDRDKLSAGLSGVQSKVNEYTKTQSPDVQQRVSQAADPYRATVPNLFKYEAPTSADQLQTPLAPTAIPTITPAAGDVTGATAGMAGLQASITANEQAQLERQKQYEKEQAANTKSWLSTMVTPTDARNQAQKETGINVKDYFATQKKGIAEVESLTKEFNAVEAARDQQIAQTNDKMASMNFINNQTAQIERNAAPKLNQISANINAKAATLQAEQGNFAEAQTYVNQAVQDATANNKFKWDMYTTMYDQNKENFDRIDSIYADSFKQSMLFAQDEYKMQKAEKTAIGELLLSNPQAGITMQDSLEQAYAKIGLTPQAVKGEIFGTAETGYYERVYDTKTNTYVTKSVAGGTGGGGGTSTSGFSSSKIESSVREDALGLLTQYGKTPEARQSAYEDLRTLYSTSEASDAALKQLVGLTTTPSTNTTTKEATISAPSGTYTSSPTGGVNTLTDLYNYLFK